ncbi:acyl-CoA N-acyltransferase [Pseudomassariella vexata]|uniref:Acyl-CoA N-acyltransferase n=1 Tax=Pseudomassariella vexata TaxID=1141098 RepID=A0A1Y2E3H0_9PEZI|nr:acyl-CoA N-acyltransferase [Pseudomassariella vexata]ORY66108.1 acyl-CoA N-acyltransferase [Pseudomassariella vexata]
MSTPICNLSRASLKDVPKLAEIAAAAFNNDAHTQMKATSPKPGSFVRDMAQGLRMWINTPSRCVVLKATNDSHGTIVGFISWGYKGVELDVPLLQSEVGSDEGGNEKGNSDPAEPNLEQTSTTTDQPQETPIQGADRIAELERLTSSHLADFQKRIMPAGTRCMYIGGITIDPVYQGKGVGSQLIRWGIEQADRNGVFCWVHSSEAGWRMFEKLGFKEVDRLTVDLDAWAVRTPRAEGCDGWGQYTFRYMVRQPAEA